MSNSRSQTNGRPQDEPEAARVEDAVHGQGSQGAANVNAASKAAPIDLMALHSFLLQSVKEMDLPAELKEIQAVLVRGLEAMDRPTELESIRADFLRMAQEIFQGIKEGRGQAQ